jgi:hypothetical protein
VAGFLMPKSCGLLRDAELGLREPREDLESASVDAKRAAAWMP